MTIIYATYVNSLLKKTKGLIGKEKPSPLYFETRFGVHTFGVKFAIDVIILSDDMQVIKVKENLMPNRLFIWNPRYKHVIELPAGTIQQRKIKQGSKLLVKRRKFHN